MLLSLARALSRALALALFLSQCLNHLCVTQFVPSYMSWGDMFTADKMGRDESEQECARVHSVKVGWGGGGGGGGGGGSSVGVVVVVV